MRKLDFRTWKHRTPKQWTLRTVLFAFLTWCAIGVTAWVVILILSGLWHDNSVVRLGVLNLLLYGLFGYTAYFFAMRHQGAWD